MYFAVILICAGVATSVDAAVSLSCPPQDGVQSVYIPDKLCTRFWQCSNGVPYLHNCPAELYFSPTLNVCVEPELSGCTNSNDDADDSGERCPLENPGCPEVDDEQPVYIPLLNCTQFCQCSNGDAYLHNCPAGLHFNPSLNVCDWPANAGCGGNGDNDDDSDGDSGKPEPDDSSDSSDESDNSSDSNESESDENDDSSDADDDNNSNGNDNGDGGSDNGKRCPLINPGCPAVDGELSVYIPLKNCSQFCQCSNGDAYLHDCPDGLHFNPKLNVCVWPEDAGCANGPGGQSTTEGSGNDDSVTTKPPADVTSTERPGDDGDDSVTTKVPGDATTKSPGGDDNDNSPNTTAKPDDGGDDDDDDNNSNTTPSPDDNENGNYPKCPLENPDCPVVDGEHPVYIPLPNCTQFCQCSNGDAYLHDCPDGLHFNSKLNVCDWPEDAGCANGPGGGSTTEGPGNDDDSVTTEAPADDDAVTTEAPGDEDDSTTTENPDDDGDDGGDDDNSNTTAKPDDDNDNDDDNSSNTTPESDENDNGNDPKCPLDNPECPAVDGEHPVYIPLPNCTQFCQCSNGDAYLHDCPDGLHFNPELNVCDWPEDAGCANGPGGGSTTEGPGNDDDSVTTEVPADDDAVTTEAPGDDDSTTTENPGDDDTDGDDDDNSSSTTPKPDDNDNDDDNNSSTTTSPDDNDNGNYPKCPLENPECPVVDGEHPVYIPLPNCTQFCQCSNGDAYLHDCPGGLHFNPKLNVCDWPEDAGCANGPGGGSTTEGPGNDDESVTTETPADNDAVTTEAPGDEDDSTTTGDPDDDSDDDENDDDSNTTAKPDDDNDNDDDNSSNTTPESDENDNGNYPKCPQDNPECPAVDGEHPVYIPLPNCTQFCQCSNGDAYLHDCPDGLHFNPKLNVCDWPEDAGCANGPGGGSTTEGPGNDDDSVTTEAPADDDAVTTVAPGDEDDSTTTGNPDDDSDDDDNDDNSNTTAKPDDDNDNDDDNSSNTTPESDDNDNGNYPKCPLENPECPAEDGEHPVYIPLPNCTQFCQCSNGDAYLHDCPDGLHFNPKLNVCDWPEDAGCANGPGGGSTTEGPGNDDDSVTTEAPADDDEVTTEAPGDEDDSTTTENPDNDSDDGGDDDNSNTTAKPDDDNDNDDDNSSNTTPESDENDNGNYPKCPLDNPECPAVDGEHPVYIPLPNCTQFCQCSNGDAYLHDCPDGLHFNPELNVCDWPEDAGCANGPGGGSTTEGPGNDDDSVTTEAPADDDAVTTEAPGDEDDSTTTENPEDDDTDDDDGDNSSSTTAKPDDNDNDDENNSSTTTSPDDNDNGNYPKCPLENPECPVVDGEHPVYIPLPNCAQFCQCSNGDAYLHDCPDGLHFNPKLNVCDWPEDAGCANGPGGGSTTEGPGNDDDSVTTEAPADDDAVTTEAPGDEDDSTTTEKPDDDSDNGGDDDNSNTTAKPDDDNDNDDDNSSSTTPESDDNDNGNYPKCPLENPDCPAVDGEHPVYIPLPNCTQFCQCSNGNAFLHDCPDGLHFNPKLNVCDWPEDAGCANEPGGGSTTEGPGNDDDSITTDASADEDAATTEAPVDEDDSTTTENPDDDGDDGGDDDNSNTTAKPDDDDDDGGDDDNSITTAKPDDDSDNDDDNSSSTTPESDDSDNGNYPKCPLENPECPAVDGEHPVYIPLPNCTQFCQCSNGDAYLHDCPDGLHFNPELNVCDWPEDAGCANGPGGGSTTEGPGNDDDSVTTEAPADDDAVTTEAPGDEDDSTTTGNPDDDGDDGGDDDNSNTTAKPDDDNDNDDDNSSSTTPESDDSDNENYPKCPLENPECPTVDGDHPVYIPLPNCIQFCQCSNGDAYLHDCPDGLHFNPKLNVCDWPEDAGCANGPGGQSTTEESGNDDDSVTTDAPADEDNLTTTEKPGDDDGNNSVTTDEPGDDDSPATENPGDDDTDDDDSDSNTTAKPDDGNDGDDDASNTTTKPDDNDNDSDRRCPLENTDCPAVDGEHPVYIPLPNYCTQFCQCSNGDAYLHDCPDGLHFNPKLNVCDRPEDAGCGNGPSSQSTTEAPGNDDSVTTEAAADDDDVKTTERPGNDDNGGDDATDGPGNDDDDNLGTTQRPGDDDSDDDNAATTQGPSDDDDNSVTTQKPGDDDDDSNDTTEPNDDNNGEPKKCPLDKPSCPAVDGQFPVYIPLPNCGQFCQCSNGDAYLHDCPDGLHFNPTLNVCDYPVDAGCTGEGSSGNSTVENKDPYEVLEENKCPLQNAVCPSVEGENPVYFTLSDCSQFCVCRSGTAYLYKCPVGRHFSPVSHVCDWPESALCEEV